MRRSRRQATPSGEEACAWRRSECRKSSGEKRSVRLSAQSARTGMERADSAREKQAARRQPTDGSATESSRSRSGVHSSSSSYASSSESRGRQLLRRRPSASSSGRRGRSPAAAPPAAPDAQPMFSGLRAMVAELQLDEAWAVDRSIGRSMKIRFAATLARRVYVCKDDDHRKIGVDPIQHVFSAVWPIEEWLRACGGLPGIFGVVFPWT